VKQASDAVNIINWTQEANSNNSVRFTPSVAVIKFEIDVSGKKSVKEPTTTQPSYNNQFRR
jgi:hypothetical protein